MYNHFHIQLLELISVNRQALCQKWLQNVIETSEGKWSPKELNRQRHLISQAFEAYIEALKSHDAKPLQYFLKDLLSKNDWLEFDLTNILNILLQFRPLVEPLCLQHLPLEELQSVFQELSAYTSTVVLEYSSAHQARMFQEKDKRRLQLDLITEVGHRSVSDIEMEKLLDLVVVTIQERFEYYNVSLFMIDEEPRELVLIAHAGAYHVLVHKGYRQKITDGMLGWTARNRKTRLANDVARDPLYIAVEGLDTQSELCVPIRIENKIIGVLNIESNQTGSFDASDITAMEMIAHQIAEAIRNRQRDDELNLFRQEAEAHQGLQNIIGNSPKMRQVLDLVRIVAKTDSTVLIRGETGTGKELVARAIHTLSARRNKPFMAINCAAIPENLLESELFGHERGAFTDARQRKLGRLELAAAGSLFLDEIGDLPLSMQVKLLRVLDQRTYTRVGGSQELKADIRIISATNRPLETLIQERYFRQDLYFRLNVVPIELPPLRDRLEDLPLFISHCLKKSCERLNKSIHSVSPSVLKSMYVYSWPGNVRELENLMERAVLLEPTSTLSSIDLPTSETLAQPQIVPKLPPSVENVSLNEMIVQVFQQAEVDYLKRVLIATKGNISLAARQAGINRRTLYNKLTKYNLDPSLFRESPRR